jgi:hypothetical protein
MTDRVPYAERERVIDQWCSCYWYASIIDNHLKRHAIKQRDPDCKLHGDQAKEAPF